MKKILVPTDFSTNAFTAAKYAAFLAVERHWQLEICHVYRPFYSGFQSEQQNQAEKAMAEKETSALMEMFIKKLKVLYPHLRISGENVVGHIEQVVPAKAEKDKATLIVMGTQGATGLKYRLLGSNTYSVIQRSKIPVMAVPSKFEKFRLKRIGFTTNYHSIEIPALQDLIDLLGSGIEIISFHLYASDKRIQEFKLKAWKEKMGKMIAYKPLLCKLSRMRSMGSGIRYFIRKERLDALAMTVIEKEYFTRIFGKNFLKLVAHQSTIPVIFFKED